MKLPWYIKQTGMSSSGEKEGKLYLHLKIRKAWIYLMYVKVFFQMIRKARFLELRRIK